jgi:hypothetical protein
LEIRPLVKPKLTHAEEKVSKTLPPQPGNKCKMTSTILVPLKQEGSGILIIGQSISLTFWGIQQQAEMSKEG